MERVESQNKHYKLNLFNLPVEAGWKLYGLEISAEAFEVGSLFNGAGKAMLFSAQRFSGRYRWGDG